MSDYCPDRWVIVRIAGKNHEPIDKVLGSWYGGYAGSDSWRFSSGITKVIEHDDRYEVHNYSGSIYELFKGAEGMAAYTAASLKKMTTQLEDSGEGTTQVIEITELLGMRGQDEDSSRHRDEQQAQ
jgi:hypothetical protein